ncbi:MAG: hypothetical protein ACHREM_26520, partial [Polyangiales bacterium]
FEDPAQLAAFSVQAMQWQWSSDCSTLNAQLLGTGPIDAPALDALTALDVAPLEGHRALRLGDSSKSGAHGVILPASAVLAAAGGKRFRITVWARAEGYAPYLTVDFATGAYPSDASFSPVYAIRSGRESSDGWAEFSTGVIEASVWDVPMSQIMIATQPPGAPASCGGTAATATGDIVIDALEIVPVGGELSPQTACTALDVDTTCGPDAECQYGHCFPAWAAWGPTPSQAHRTEIVERWITFGTHVQAARNAIANAAAMVTEEPALTAPNIGGRAFYTELLRLMNAWRNQHTSFGASANLGLLQPFADISYSSSIGACFGAGELDLLEPAGATSKTMGWMVFQAAPTAMSGTLLKPGDALTQIDGIDPRTWVEQVWGTYSYGVAADPSADLGWASVNIAALLSHRAHTVQVTRCESATACDVTHRTRLNLDLSTPLFAKVHGVGSFATISDSISCGVRLQDAVADYVPSDSNGNDMATAQTVGDTVMLEFDGTYSPFSKGSSPWSKAVTAALTVSPAPTKILIDTRQGNGGYVDNARILSELLRPPSEPVAFVDFPIGAWNVEPASGLFADLDACLSGAVPGYCSPFTYWYSNAGVVPPDTLARVALLIDADVSANDYLTAMLAGHAGLHVLGPNATSGSYGTIASTAPMLWGWYGGSMQMTDSRWGASEDDVKKPSTAFRSGLGVAPDQLVGQTMSDVLKGRDTLLIAAQAWLDGK